MKNNLPKGWEWKTLEYLCDKASSNVSQNQLNNEVGEYPIFGASGLIKKVSFYHQENEYIGIVKDGAGVGRVTLLPKNSSVIGTLQYLLPKKNIDINFLFYFLKGLDFLKFISGSTIPHIYFKSYKDEPFPFPTLSEQKQIVAVLENSFTKIDQAILLVKQNIEKIKQLNESALSEVFEELLNKNKLIKLGILDDIKAGGTPSRTNKEYWNGNINWFSSGELNTKFINYSKELITVKGLENSNAKIFPINTLFVGMYDTAAFKMSILKNEATCNQAIVGIKPNNRFITEYLFYQLTFLKPKVLRLRQGIRQQNLNSSKIKNLDIYLPSILDQQRIVSHLDRLTQNNSQLLQHYQKKLEALQRLKNSVLESAFKGELRREQKTKTFNLAFYQMQLMGLSIEANKQGNIAQGEMAIAKDMYLLDRLYNVPTKMNYLNHNFGPFAPEIKKGITNKIYFGKKNFPNSKATYVVTQKDDALFRTVSTELKNQVFEGINDLNSKIFTKVSPYKRANTKELLATVLKCIEDTQSTELATIREAMKNWKIELEDFKTKAEKFSEKRTQLVIKFIIKENWHLKVLR